MNILLIDTEGLGSFDQDSKHDSQIFTLALLICSYFIYNSMGTIDEQALDKLSMVVNLSKHIHIKENSNEDLSPFLPKFLWLVRDFSLKLVDNNNNPITSQEYLEGVLNFKSKIESKNEIRRFIKKYFPKRDCYTLPRPVVDEEELQKLDSIPYKDLRENFKEMMTNLKNKVFNEVQAKNLNGSALCGNTYICLIESYLNAINNGAIPNIDSAWTNITQAENQRILNELINTYMKLMSEGVKKLPVEEEDLNQTEHKVKLDIMMQFEKRAMGEKKKIEQIRKLLIDHLSKEFQIIQSRNRNESLAHCERVAHAYFKNILEDLKSGKIDSIEKLIDSFKAFKHSYFNNAVGFSKHKVFLKYFDDEIFQSFLHFFNKQSDSFRSLLESKLKASQLDFEKRSRQLEQFHQSSLSQAEENFSLKYKSLTDSFLLEKSNVEQQHQKEKKEFEMSKKIFYIFFKTLFDTF